LAHITKQMAESIARKLGATVVARPGSAHDRAEIFHEGRRVAWFGIRRGSQRDLGHDFIPRQIYVSPREARLLAQCPLKREHWVAILTEKGIV